MFGAECRERRGVKYRPEQDQLLECSRLLPFSANKDHDYADGKNDAADKIRPEYLVGNREENDDCQRIDELAAHDRSFRLANEAVGAGEALSYHPNSRCPGFGT